MQFITNMKVLLLVFVFSLLSLNVVLPISRVVAAPCTPDQSVLGIPTWYKYLEAETDSTNKCSPKIDDASAALPIGLAVLEGAIRIAGLVAVVMIFISAFKFMLAQGNPEPAKEARMTAINALIGLVIVILATSIISYIGNTLT